MPWDILYVAGGALLICTLAYLGMARIDRKWQADLERKFGEPLPSRDFPIASSFDEKSPRA